MEHEPHKDPGSPSKDGPDRRQILSGTSALVFRTALPLGSLAALTGIRPGGWILTEDDRDVS